MNTRPAPLAWLVLAIAALIATNAHADQFCKQWRATATPTPPWDQSPEAARDRWFAGCPQGEGTSVAGPTGCNHSCNSVGYSLSYTGPTGPTGTWPGPLSYTWSVTRTKLTAPFDTATCSVPISIATQTDPAGCPICPPAGTRDVHVMAAGVVGAAGAGTSGSDGCAYKVCALATAVTLITSSGPKVTQCVESLGYPSNATPQALGNGESDTDDCVAGDGNVACGTGTNCGEVNGDRVCLGAVPPDKCVGFDSGGVACGASAPTPPVPDNGTPGTPAAPDATVSNGTTTVNYYSSTTVNSSGTPPTTSPPHSGDPQGTVGGTSGGGTVINCDGPDCVEVDLEGECPEGQTCDGALPDAGEFGEVCTFQECAQGFMTRVSNAPLLAALASASTSFPAGSCPVVNITMYGETMSLSDPICDIWSNQIAGAVSALMLIIFAWAATRIVLSS